MKKVAILLKGAVAKKGGNHDRFYTKEDLYKNGEYVDYKSVGASIHKYIIEPNSKYYEFDIFLHCWNKDLENELIDLYKPKKSLFEDNANYHKVIESFLTNPKDFGGVSGSLSLKKSIELKEVYEIEKKINYDIVIIYRYDVLLWKNIILDLYNTSEYIYVNSWDGSANADYHFIMSNQNSSVFKYLFDSIYLYNNLHKFHYWIKNYVVNIIGRKMIEDNIKVGIDQEHLRVLNNKI